MGYDAPLPFVPGFWVPACAGKTVYLRLSPSPWDPLLISPWEGEGDGSRERGFNRRALFFSGFPPARE